MNRVKSRNFILMICSYFIVFILILAFSKFIIGIINDTNHIDNEQEMLKNIILSSSEVKLIGNGNFINGTPMVSGVTISDFNVKLSGINSMVKYSIKFCNMNEYPIIYEQLLEKSVYCTNDFLEKVSCDNVKVSSYILSGNRRIKRGEKIGPNSCVKVIIDARRIDENFGDINVVVDRLSLKLSAKNNK